MNHRTLGNVGEVSEVGYGAWQIGSDWGDVTESEAVAAVEAARDAGIDFFDTADVYGDGRSERVLGDVLEDDIDADEVTVATKAGRRLDPHVPDGYTETNLRRFVNRSRENLGMETLDLVQLHCPPTDVYYQPETFDALAALADEGKIANYGSASSASRRDSKRSSISASRRSRSSSIPSASVPRSCSSTKPPPATWA